MTNEPCLAGVNLTVAETVRGMDIECGGLDRGYVTLDF